MNRKIKKLLGGIILALICRVFSISTEHWLFGIMLIEPLYLLTF